MTSNLHRMYSSILATGTPVDPTLAALLFDTAEHAGELSDCAEVARLENLPEDLSDRCRTHRNSKVRAAWLSSPQRTDAEIDEALRRDRADSAFVVLAKASTDQALLTKISARRSITVQHALGENPATPVALFPSIIEVLAPSSRGIGSLLMRRIEARPHLHDAYVAALAASGSIANLHSYTTSSVCSPFLSEKTLDAVLSALETHPHHYYSLMSRVTARRTMPSALAPRTLKLIDDYNNDTSFRGHTMSPANFVDDTGELAAIATAAHDHKSLKLLLRNNPSSSDIAALVATHPASSTDDVVSAMETYAQTATQRRYHTYRYAEVESELVRTWMHINPEFAAQVALRFAQPGILLKRGVPAGVDLPALTTACLGYALEHPSHVSNSYSWRTLVTEMESSEQLLRMPLSLFLAHGRWAPPRLRVELADRLAAELGTADAYSALATLSDSDLTLADMMTTVTLIMPTRE